MAKSVKAELTPDKMRSRVNEMRRQINDLAPLLDFDASAHDLIDEIDKMRSSILKTGILLLHNYTKSYLEKIDNGEDAVFDQEIFEELVSIIRAGEGKFISS